MTKAKRQSRKNEEVESLLPISPDLLTAHPGITEAIAQWKKSGKTPPVLLLTGPRGCGKRIIATYIAQALQCDRVGLNPSLETSEEPSISLFGNSESMHSASASSASNESAPCGECPSCKRAMAGNAIDFTELTLDEDEKTFGVDRFREIKEKQGFSSFTGGAKIYLIADADRMTLSAANSVLKLLEEPPAGWIFLLTVADPSLLPSTVVSRCQMLRLRPLPEETLKKLLEAEDLPSERIATVVRIAEGSLSRAMELAGDDAWEARGNILRFLGQPSSVYHTLIDYAASEPHRFRLLLDQFEHLLSDLIQTADHPKNEYKNRDAKKALEDHSKKCASRKGGTSEALAFWIERSERLFKIRRELTAPLNAKVLIQDFLSPWMDAV